MKTEYVANNAYIHIYNNILNRRLILKWRLHKFASLLANSNEGEDSSTGLYFFGRKQLLFRNGKLLRIVKHLCSISVNAVV